MTIDAAERLVLAPVRAEANIDCKRQEFAPAFVDQRARSSNAGTTFYRRACSSGEFAPLRALFGEGPDDAFVNAALSPLSQGLLGPSQGGNER